MARCIWALVDGELAEHLCETTEPSAKQWIFLMIDTLSHDAFVKLGLTLWDIWWARRKAIHEEIFQIPLAMHLFIIRLIQDLMLMPKKAPSASKQQASSTTKPKASPPGYSKIHVDARLARGQATWSAPAVCRDEHNIFLGNSTLIFYGITDVAILESIACREALFLEDDLQLRDFIVASDSKQVINDIARGSHGGYGAIIKEITQRALSFNCIFTLEGRGTNI